MSLHLFYLGPLSLNVRGIFIKEVVGNFWIKQLFIKLHHRNLSAANLWAADQEITAIWLRNSSFQKRDTR